MESFSGLEGYYRSGSLLLGRMTVPVMRGGGGEAQYTLSILSPSMLLPPQWKALLVIEE